MEGLAEVWSQPVTREWKHTQKEHFLQLATVLLGLPQIFLMLGLIGLSKEWHGR